MVSENSISTKNDDRSINESIPASLNNKTEEILVEDQRSITNDEESNIAVVAMKDEENPKEPFTIFPTSRLIQFLVITSFTGNFLKGMKDCVI